MSEHTVEKDAGRRPRLLDLYCCAGGAAMGYHRAGFDVFGVDLAAQPHYPFDFKRGNAITALDHLLHFESNVELTAPEHPKHAELTFTHDKRKAHYGQPLDLTTMRVQVTGGGNAPVWAKRQAMGDLDWMTGREVNEAIPPAYTEHLGRQIRAHIDASAARWGLTWVGGTLSYDTKEDAERAQRRYASGRVLPPGEGRA